MKRLLFLAVCSCIGISSVSGSEARRPIDVPLSYNSLSGATPEQWREIQQLHTEIQRLRQENMSMQDDLRRRNKSLFFISGNYAGFLMDEKNYHEYT